MNGRHCEPDIDIRPAGEGQLQVEIRGLDVYDPTTGAVRSSSTDDIAAWFLDADYDGLRGCYVQCVDGPTRDFVMIRLEHPVARRTPMDASVAR